jgi:hypothetical protein
MLPPRLVVGAVNSSDPSPVGCQQEAKRGALRRLHRDRGGERDAPAATGVFYAKPGPTGTLTRKGDFYKSIRGARRSCRTRVDPKARRLEHHRDLGSMPYNCGARDMMRQRRAPTGLSALTLAALSLTPGRRIKKCATSIRSRHWESSVFSSC